MCTAADLGIAVSKLISRLRNTIRLVMAVMKHILSKNIYYAQAYCGLH